LIRIKNILLDQSGEAPDSIRLESTGQRINKLSEKFRAVDVKPGPPHFHDFGVCYATGKVTAPQDANGVLLFTQFAQYQIEQNDLLLQLNLADFQEQIILALAEVFQVDGDCYNIQRVNFEALHGGGNTGSPGSNQPTGQSSGGGQPPASPMQEVAAFVLQREAESEERHLLTLEKVVGASETRTLQMLEKMVEASEARQGQSFATLMEALDRRQNDARGDSEKRLLQAMKHSAEMVLKHSQDYTDQRFNELQSQLVSYVDKKVAAENKLNQEESETLKASLMALEMELSKGASSNNKTNEPFTLATGQTGFYADGELKLPPPTPARNTPGGIYDDSSQREVSDFFVLTNGQRAFYENGRVCLMPFRNPSSSNDRMAESKGHVHSDGSHSKPSPKRARKSLSLLSDSNSPSKQARTLEGGDSKPPPKRARKSLSLLSDSKSPSKKARTSEGASSVAAALQSEAGDSHDMEFFDANQ